MKYQLLVALLFVLISCVKSDLLLKYIQFEYDIEKCSKQSSSSDFMTGGGSFGEEIKRVGGFIDSNGSDDSSDESCDNDEYNSITYIKLNQCGIFGGLYTMFQINYNDGTIVKETYSESTCNETSPVTEIIKLFQCFDDCKTGPYLYSISDTGDLEIPKGTFVSVYYDGVPCNGWKNDFIQIQYFPLNKCMTTGMQTSYMYTCNSTNYELIISNRYNCYPESTSYRRTNTEIECFGKQNLEICYN
ncbi:hypothetical protein RB653_009108 [Dictyostelium firmibasis]|uniref:Uncharacterized protein n=1 Tax=Dictyostelium firmibasis TaxID=79012 RepID=A0AAN7Z0C6_9MYCE